MDKYTAEYRTPHGLARSHLVPDQLPAPRLAHALAAKWVEVARINPSAVTILRVAIVRLCEHVTSELGFDVCQQSISDLRRRHIDSWEGTLVKWQAELGSDYPYRVAVYMFAFLRYIEDRQPGTLDPELDIRIRQPTRLSHIRGEPLSDFSDAELTVIKDAVRKLTRNDDGWTKVASADVILAFHIALCISSGEPPEVLRALTLDDIVATSADPRSAGVGTAQIAAAGLADSYAVTLRKNRAHIVEEVTWSRRENPTTVRYLDALITLGEPLRRAAGQRSIWMMTDRGGRVVSAPWRSLSFSDWISAHVAGRISSPHDPRRFRKAAVAADIIADPPRYLRTQRRHTQDVLFDHYTNSPKLRQDAGERYVSSVTELYDRAVGPIIDTGKGVFQLDTAASQEVALLAEREAPPTVAGALTGCRDPLTSPHAPPGEVCPMSRAGTCFTCPNAVITAEHLPALVLVNAVSAPDAAVNPSMWQTVWGAIHEATTTILHMFSREAVDDARRHTDEVLVDLGLRHELRGPSDGPTGA